jgi:hypothetical protein
VFRRDFRATGECSGRNKHIPFCALLRQIHAADRRGFENWSLYSKLSIVEFLALANGTSIVHLAVLATGHDEEPGAGQGHAIRMGSEADTALDPKARVLVLGTGLSIIDALLSLEQCGHRREIVAASQEQSDQA